MEYIATADSILTANGPVSGLALIIKGGLIDDLGSVSGFHRGIKTLDFPGHMICPCFCDHHLHLHGRGPGEYKMITDTLISNGITKAWEGGDREQRGLEAMGRLSVRTAGCAIYKKGAYGKFIGKGVATMREAEDAVDLMIEKGADYIKVVNSGVFLPDTGDISAGGFSLQELKHIIGYVKSKGLEAACHSNGAKAVQEAVEAGAAYIIHGLGISGETLSLMAEKGTAFIPTVSAFACLKKISKTPKGIFNIEKAVGLHLAALKEASLRGVRMLAGSDAGPSFIPYGTSLHEELSLFKRAGLSVEQVLSCAVSGWLEKGAGADFLVLDGLSVKKVFIGGIPLS